MVFSNEYTQQPLLPNSHSCSSTSNFGLEINPFHHQNFTHEMGSYFLPQSPIYHHQDPQPNNEATPSSYLPNHQNNLPCNQEAEPLSLSKKDRHTKISTAHGYRDRRVRLSMEVAREFFDLQDMLGFDKASKTLGWLLANSKSAIQELALEKKGLDSFSFETSHEDQIGSSTTIKRKRKKKIRVLSDVGKEQSASCKSISSVVAKEKRAKARERARERTKEKMSSKLQFEHHGFNTNEIGYGFSDLNCRFVQGDDPEATISGLYGWRTNGN